MRYALLIYGDEESPEARRSDEERRAWLHIESIRRSLAGLRKDRKRIKLLSRRRGELQPVATATAVRVRDGDTIVSDGPFAETKEVLGGFYLIDLSDSLDDAIRS